MFEPDDRLLSTNRQCDVLQTFHMAHRGVPRIAPPEVAQRILTRLQKLSAPFGTTITIENGVGIIRPAARNTSAQ